MNGELHFTLEILKIRLDKKAVFQFAATNVSPEAVNSLKYIQVSRLTLLMLAKHYVACCDSLLVSSLHKSECRNASDSSLHLEGVKEENGIECSTPSLMGVASLLSGPD